ncbi:hypothetical protein FB451DRAFT_1020216, partial [Mycena latifolia]
HIPEEQVDEEIFEAVQKTRARQQDREKTGGDDDEESDLKPTRREALQAVSALCKYITDLDEPFAWKLEGMLATFGCETHCEEAKVRVDTSITDYFVHS